MRRVVLTVTGTIAGLVALLSFKSHVPTSPQVNLCLATHLGHMARSVLSSERKIQGL